MVWIPPAVGMLLHIVGGGGLAACNAAPACFIDVAKSTPPAEAATVAAFARACSRVWRH